MVIFCEIHVPRNISLKKNNDSLLLDVFFFLSKKERKKKDILCGILFRKNKIVIRINIWTTLTSNVIIFYYSVWSRFEEKQTLSACKIVRETKKYKKREEKKKNRQKKSYFFKILLIKTSYTPV